MPTGLSPGLHELLGRLGDVAITLEAAGLHGANAVRAAATELARLARSNQALNDTNSTIATTDLPTMYNCLQTLLNETALLIDRRMVLAEHDVAGRPVGNAGAHYETLRQRLLAHLTAAELPSDEVRRDAVRAASLGVVAEWARLARHSWMMARRSAVETIDHAITRLLALPASADEEARLLAEVKSAYAVAKNTWTGRTWHDGDKVTPEATDDQIAKMLTRGEDIAITCWGIDPSDEVYRRRARTALEALNLIVGKGSDEEFSVACDALRELAVESDAGVAAQARLAESTAQAAMRAVKLGDKSEALQLAEEAARIERQFGDAPSWGPFAEAIRAWNEHG